MCENFGEVKFSLQGKEMFPYAKIICSVTYVTNFLVLPPHKHNEYKHENMTNSKRNVMK